MTTLGSPPSLGAENIWHLCLYIMDRTPKSISALNNLKRICEEHLAGRYQVEVVDLAQQPQRAASDQIVAIPTLVGKFSSATRKVIGDLSNTTRVLAALRL